MTKNQQSSLLKNAKHRFHQKIYINFFHHCEVPVALTSHICFPIRLVFSSASEFTHSLSWHDGKCRNCPRVWFEGLCELPGEFRCWWNTSLMGKQIRELSAISHLWQKFMFQICYVTSKSILAQEWCGAFLYWLITNRFSQISFH